MALGCGDNTPPVSMDAGFPERPIQPTGPETVHGVPVLYWQAGFDLLFEIDNCTETFTTPDGTTYPTAECTSSDGSGDDRYYVDVLLSINGGDPYLYCKDTCGQ